MTYVLQTHRRLPILTLVRQDRRLRDASEAVVNPSSDG